MSFEIKKYDRLLSLQKNKCFPLSTPLFFDILSTCYQLPHVKTGTRWSLHIQLVESFSNRESDQMRETRIGRNIID